MLIICEECGKEISDKSNVCIHCGWPLELAKVYSLELISFNYTQPVVENRLRELLHIDVDEVSKKIEKSPYSLVEWFDKEKAFAIAEVLDSLPVEYKLYKANEVVKSKINLKIVPTEPKSVHDKKLINQKFTSRDFTKAAPRNKTINIYKILRNSVCSSQAKWYH